MARFTSKQAVASMVEAAPGTSRVFERFGIDFCCGGRIALEDACAKKGLDPRHVLREIEVETGRAEQPASAPPEGLTALVEHILAKHHTFVHRELPRLTVLMDKVLRVHGPSRAQIPPIAQIWSRIAPALDLHMRKEEEILFPAILALDAGRPSSFGCASGLEGPMSMMEIEHEEAGEAFAAMRSLANGYAPPPDACGSWRALYGGLDEFEKDLHVHVHLENNLLFPRVRAKADRG